MQSDVLEAFHLAIDKIARHRDLRGFPHIAPASAPTWITTPDGVWTGGFWVGLLWIAYYETRDDVFQQVARNRARTLAQVATRTPNHDLGMMFLPSAVLGWEITYDDDLAQVAHDAARALASQWNPAAQFIPGWGFFGHADWAGKALIDTLMNLPLLLWDGDPKLLQIAVAHAHQSLRYHVRDDGSTAHVVDFNPLTGEILHQDTYQGAGPSSCWSRGQAWAIAGLVAMAKFVDEEAFIINASRLAEYFWAHSQGAAPSWDFSDPHGTRDTAAGAIACYAMFRLADMTAKPLWRERAQRMLTDLVERYLADDAPYILAAQTADLPHGLAVEGGTIYGDYFFVRSLQQALNHPMPECF